MTDRAGFHTVQRVARIGHGDEVFMRAAAVVLGWDMHRGAGLSVTADSDRAEVGGNVVVGMPFGPVQVLAPCRVTVVVDDQHSAGFRYATLPGHPERGLEEFFLEQDGTGAVVLRIRALSRPGSVLTALGAPVGRFVQRRVTDRYVAAVIAGSA